MESIKLHRDLSFFVMPPFERDLDSIALLLSILHSVQPSSRPDERIWTLDPAKGLSCAYFYLQSVRPSQNNDPLLVVDFVWKAKLPIKLRTLAWLVILSQLNMMENLQTRRLYSSFSPNQCSVRHKFCKYFHRRDILKYTFHLY